MSKRRNDETEGGTAVAEQPTRAPAPARPAQPDVDVVTAAFEAIIARNEREIVRDAVERHPLCVEYLTIIQREPTPEPGDGERMAALLIALAIRPSLYQQDRDMVLHSVPKLTARACGLADAERRYEAARQAGDANRQYNASQDRGNCLAAIRSLESHRRRRTELFEPGSNPPRLLGDVEPAVEST